MGKNVLIRGGHVVDPSQGIDGLCDILLQDGRVAAVGTDLSADGCEIFDATGQYVSPGFVEMHAHLRDPGDTERDTMYAATCSALCGGFTSVAAMPNTIPTVDTPERVRAVIQRAEESAVVNIFPLASATVDRAGKEPVDMAALKAAGAVGFSDDGNAIGTASMMRTLLAQTKQVDLVLDVHCEDKEYSGSGVVNAGPLAERLGLPGLSSVAEDVMIARDLIVQEEVRGNLHIAHLGSERAVELVRFFRERGVPFSCEVIPHQFTLTEDVVERLGTRAKVKPPLRSAEDRDGIRRGMHDQLIDVVATDHCPYADKEIDCGLTGTKLFGLAGFETTFPLLLALVHAGTISLSYAIACLTENPAKILRLKNKGTLRVGADADVTVFRPEVEWTVKVAELKTKASNSPYDNYPVKGKVTSVFIGGELAYHNGNILRQVKKPDPSEQTPCR